MASAAIGLGLSYLSSQAQKSSVKSATAAANAGELARQQQLQQAYAETKPMFNNYLGAGDWATRQLQQQLQQPGNQYTFADWQSDPVYAGIIEEGNKAINRQAAAGGGSRLAGGTLQALQNNATTSANRMYGDAFARNMASRQQTLGNLQQLSGQGLSATTSLGGMRMNTGQQVGNSMAQIGQNNAVNAVQQGNLQSGFLQSMANPLNMAANMFAPNTNTSTPGLSSNVIKPLSSGGWLGKLWS